MSKGRKCKCDNPLWIVLHYRHNHSYFEYPKGQEHPSDYSTIKCENCGAIWSTKAKYVEDLQIKGE